MEQSELETVNLIRQISLWQEERARQLQQQLQQAASALLTAGQLVAEEMKYFHELRKAGDLRLLKEAVSQIPPAEENITPEPRREPPQLQ
ncbi:MAG: hypothetical protein QM368_04155 [Bacillota bacterium]|jgi:hypothetical protein|nr:hypothetical protein [Bacillota bacterium]HHU29667.1 hypothetical protein [Bacillota bacterium]